MRAIVIGVAWVACFTLGASLIAALIIWLFDRWLNANRPLGRPELSTAPCRHCGHWESLHQHYTRSTYCAETGCTCKRFVSRRWQA